MARELNFSTKPNMTEHFQFYDYEFPPYRQFILAPVGSWNYECADEHSDVDTKAIFLPSIDDVIEGKCEAYTHLLPNGEHIDCCDIRNYMKSLIKGNPQFVETIFSSWIYPNDEFYGEEVYALLNMREKIARCNPQNTMRAFLGMADRNYSLVNDRFYEDHINKWAYQLMRIEECMCKYGQGRSFKDCLISNKRDDLLAVKNGEFSKEELISKSATIIDICKTHYDVMKAINEPEDKWTQRLVKEIVKQVCKKSIERVD